MPKRTQIGLWLGLLAALSMWCYVNRVLVPHQKADAAARGVPRGNLSDLYPRWLGARELLLHGRDPYSPEITREIQMGYYGRPLDPARFNDPKDQQGFAYPVYVTFLLAPTVRLPFSVVQAGFRWLLLVLTALSVPLWLKALNQRVSRATSFVWITFALASFAAAQGIKLQQLSLLVCAILAGALAAMASGHLVVAGVLLALATIKPQLVLILSVWLFAWTVADWRRRRSLFRSFAVTLLVLITASNLILPGWISQFRTAAADYLQYTGGGRSLLDVLLTPTIGRWISLCVLAGTAVVCWRSLRAAADTTEFKLALSVVLAATLVVIPTYAPYNQLLLIPTVMLAVEHATLLWRRGRLFRMFLLVAGLCLAWPWVTAMMLDTALLIYPAVRVQNAWSVPLFTSLLIPIAVLGVAAMMAIHGLREGQQAGA